MQSPEMMMLEPSLSPLSAYFSPREKRSDTYKMEVERREINTIFCLFDIDGSGYVSKDEMESLLIAITHELDEAQLNRLMAELVSNNEQADEISFEDFYNWCHHHIHANNHSKEKLIEEIFKMIDTDNSGFITIDVSFFKCPSNP
jgi:Ca2+-binding EF-hand superfamily protein